MPVRLLGVVVSSDRRLDGQEVDAPPDVLVGRGAGPAPQPNAWIGADDWPRIAIDGGDVILSFEDEAVFVLNRDRREITYHLFADLDEHTFAHELVDAVLPRYLALLGIHVLHGSSVCGPAGAVVLVGQSGAGKSTLAASLVADGAVLLGDDAAAIVDLAGAPHVVPSGTSLRLYEEAATAALGPRPVLGPAMAHWSAKRLLAPADNTMRTAPVPVPLRVVVELAEPDTSGTSAPALVPLDGGATFELLARNSFDLPDKSPDAGISMLERWAPLAGQVRAFRLHRRQELDELAVTRRLLASLLADPLPADLA
jgi:hypothetical protein